MKSKKGKKHLLMAKQTASTSTSAKAKAEKKEIPLLHPDEFGSGQPDDFDGAVVGACFAPWKWPRRKDGKYQLYALLDIEPDAETGMEPFMEPIQVAWLNNIQPSHDGVSPAGGALNFYEALGDGMTTIEEGKEDQYHAEYINGRLPPSGDFSYFVSCLKRLEFTNFASSISDMLVGQRFHFSRDVNPNRKNKSDDSKGSDFKILVPDAILEEDTKPRSAAGKKSSAASKATAAAAADDEDDNGAAAAAALVSSSKTKKGSKANSGAAVDEDFESRLELQVIEILTEADGPLPIQRVRTEAMHNAENKHEAPQIMKYLRNADWYADESRPWTVDEDNTLSI